MIPAHLSMSRSHVIITVEDLHLWNILYHSFYTSITIIPYIGYRLEVQNPIFFFKREENWIVGSWTKKCVGLTRTWNLFTFKKCHPSVKLYTYVQRMDWSSRSMRDSEREREKVNLKFFSVNYSSSFKLLFRTDGLIVKAVLNRQTKVVFSDQFELSFFVWKCH